MWQFGRRIAVGCVCVVLFLQIFRIYLRRNPSRPSDLTSSLPKLEKRWPIPCTGKRFSEFVSGCSPKDCDRYVVDRFVSADIAYELRELAEFGMKHGGGAGGATILDLPSGALSHGEQFIDVHQILASKNTELPKRLVSSFLDVTKKVRAEVMSKYGLQVLYPTTPRFFSRMDGSKPAKTAHDEYWHNHIDAQQYPGFEYTALIYLNEQGSDFKGGEFSFVDTLEGGQEELTIIKPSAGRLVMFTSGSENVHRVHKVESGKRYALTIAFTCDKSRALEGQWAS